MFDIVARLGPGRPRVKGFIQLRSELKLFHFPDGFGFIEIVGIWKRFKQLFPGVSRDNLAPYCGNPHPEILRDFAHFSGEKLKAI